MTGVGYHANVLNAALQKRLITPARIAAPIVMAMLCMLVPLLLYPRLRLSTAWWVCVGLNLGMLGLWLAAGPAGGSRPVPCWRC